MKIAKCIQRNKAAGNERGKINPRLEMSMLREELVETEVALGMNNITEVIDGCIDIIYVAIGTLHKL